MEPSSVRTRSGRCFFRYSSRSCVCVGGGCACVWVGGCSVCVCVCVCMCGCVRVCVGGVNQQGHWVQLRALKAAEIGKKRKASL